MNHIDEILKKNGFGTALPKTGKLFKTRISYLDTWLRRNSVDLKQCV